LPPPACHVAPLTFSTAPALAAPPGPRHAANMLHHHQQLCYKLPARRRTLLQCGCNYYHCCGGCCIAATRLLCCSTSRLSRSCSCSTAWSTP
jgi:hypothetical protein